ncbi:Predicted restriction endonuclease [Plesiomonas shigelloides]|uniref:HNH endonuclease n=3 Tax=Plesiomonas TaxID=702 RepID=UPI000E055FC6|nr:HNH endonuclease [Plesiomonas shigelloides]SUB63591.1 Predicted restriction endonuclease [Plesiomonas shigelloides]
MSNNWTEQELRAAVEAYVQMHSDEANGVPFVKKQIYAELADRFDRTEKSFEYRMQNISYVYSLMGREWVSGLKPAKNVGSNNAAVIERLISEVEGQNLPKVAEFETQVILYKSKKNLSKPNGIKEPEKTYSQVTNFNRDPKVKAWVLKEASGKCECCDSEAPFSTAEGEPFLEVHHLRRLADGGSDMVTNAVALCPNCHREMHYGVNKSSLVGLMYKKVSRLMHE